MMNTPLPGLMPPPAPQEVARIRRRYRCADQPADPHAMLSALSNCWTGTRRMPMRAAGAGAYRAGGGHLRIH